MTGIIKSNNEPEKIPEDNGIDIELMEKMDRYGIDIRFLLDKKDN